MFANFFKRFRPALAFGLVAFVLALGQCQAQNVVKEWLKHPLPPRQGRFGPGDPHP